jgi:hypothetical protein
MEHFIDGAVSNHLSLSNFFMPKQLEFREGQSTLSALLICQLEYISYLDDKADVDAIFFDSAKVFDTVNHEILLPNFVLMVLVADS